MKEMKEMIALLLFFSSCFLMSYALNNGLAITPPMGWLSWERFRCNIDCENDPMNCISEQLYKEMADHLVKDGYLQEGYNFVNIDDCWSELERNPEGELVADKTRFPNGIKALADYVHAKGLKLGIYGDIGTKTCGGYPGSQDYIKQDAITFAKWGVDSLKLDGCNAQTSDYPINYPAMGAALNATGRPIVYACSWPAYIIGSANFTQIAHYCNYWRAYDDIQDDWASVANIIEWWGSNQNQLVPAAGPGAWNDPDMIIAGDFDLSFVEAETQFAIWAIVAAPLIMSNDLRKIDPKMKEILLNREVIAVNQDPLGKQGQRVLSKNNGQVQWWLRPLADRSVALAIYYVGENDGSLQRFQTEFSEIGYIPSSSDGSVLVRDLYLHQDLGKFKENFIVSIPPHGVAMLKLT